LGSLTALILLTLLFSACNEKTTENTEKKVTSTTDTYLESRVNAVNMAKESVKKSDEAVKKQNEMMEGLIK